VTPKSLIEPARHAGTALLRSQTDARLVDLTRDGNERAFEAIVQRYRRPLLRYCSRLLSPARAEDAVQQAFLSAHRAIHSGDAELNLRPWLYRIAHNASLNQLRQAGFDHDQVSEEIDGVETPPQAFERSERLRTVVAAVQELPERQRSAIVLQAVEGRSYDEIATELGVSDGAVRQLLNRARNTLREAAAAITPTGLLTRFASSGGEATVAERVAQAVAGAGGGAFLAKAGATLVVAGAVAGGTATGGLPGVNHHRDGRSGARGAAEQRTQASVAGGSAAASGGQPENAVLTGDGSGARHGSSRGTYVRNLSSGPGSHGGRGQAGDGRGGASHEHGIADNSGPSDDGSGSGDRSGSGDHGSSGSGGGGGDSSGGGGDSSGSSDGSGSGGGSSEPDHGGSSDSGSDSSGSGSSGSGSDGSEDPVPTTGTLVGSGSGKSDAGDDSAGDGGDPTGFSTSGGRH
jgi:RNA polymerase sigma factor (sigma-70 family)